MIASWSASTAQTPRARPPLAGQLALACRTTAPTTAPTVTTLRTSCDAFHQPRSRRYARGDLSPEGYYLDSVDYASMVATCLLPFLRGAAEVRLSQHDHRADAETVVSAADVPPRAVLVVDGVFLLRPELRTLWSLSIYLHISPDETLRRARRRDVDLFGSVDEVDRRYLSRYLPAQEHYRQLADPESHADVIVDNHDPHNPRIERP
jgi:uridine kinase